MERSDLRSEAAAETETLRNEFFCAHDPNMLISWQSACVGIAGAGGLGSNIAVSLTRAGIGRLIIADHDVVSVSNLNRQQFYLDQVGLPKVEALKANLERISPFTQVIIHQLRVCPENLLQLFGNCDILVEAFDLADQKLMLIENWLDLYDDRPLISASGLAGVGNNNSIDTMQSGNLYVVGDQSSELQPGISPVSARVAVVANMQANLSLELLLAKQWKH